jgi:putative ABC transport system permease protein
MANLPLSNVFHRKVKTGISVVSVAVEVALVLIVIGLVYGNIKEAAHRVANVGAEILFQAPDSSPFFVLNAGVLPIALTEEIGRVEGVEVVAPVLLGRITRIKNALKVVAAFGIEPQSYNLIGAGIRIVEGRGLEEPDDLVVDTVLSSSDGIRVGDSLSLLNRDFHVSGICEAGAGARIYAHISTLALATAQSGKASFFFVKVGESEDIGEVAVALEKKFEGYRVTALEGLFEAMRESAFGLRELVRVLSAMAVLISFLVILLAMYTSVNERAREIGVLKALGASRLYILRQVLIESLILCLLGILLGFLLYFLGKQLIYYLYPTLTVALDPQWFVIAAALGIAGGLLGALYPALRAALLDPVVALNVE